LTIHRDIMETGLTEWGTHPTAKQLPSSDDSDKRF
jgi:hypothetical protein